mmetsp:Transcript_35345/g.109070  ORF Transcript_35345/g.109070 Transcript_35345/m.109070 type:complete len:342 (+) Transcript_35345:413-1438(+)
MPNPVAVGAIVFLRRALAAVLPSFARAENCFTSAAVSAEEPPSTALARATAMEVPSTSHLADAGLPLGGDATTIAGCSPGSSRKRQIRAPFEVSSATACASGGSVTARWAVHLATSLSKARPASTSNGPTSTTPREAQARRGSAGLTRCAAAKTAASSSVGCGISNTSLGVAPAPPRGLRRGGGTAMVLSVLLVGLPAADAGRGCGGLGGDAGGSRRWTLSRLTGPSICFPAPPALAGVGARCAGAGMVALGAPAARGGEVVSSLMMIAPPGTFGAAAGMSTTVRFGTVALRRSRMLRFPAGAGAGAAAGFGGGAGAGAWDSAAFSRLGWLYLRRWSSLRW